MKKKLLAMALATAMTVSMAACGSGEGGDGSGVSITIFNSKVEIQDQFEEMAREYSEATGVNVEVYYSGDTVAAHMATKYSSNDPYTIAMVDAKDIYSLAEEHAIDLSGEDWVANTNYAICTSGLVMDGEARTTLAFVETLPGGDRDFSFYRNPGADMLLREEELREELLHSAGIFHFGTLSMTHEGVRGATRKAVDIARKSGALLSFDPNLRPPLWASMEEAREQVAYGLSQCHILKISDNELRWFTGEQDFDAGIRCLRNQYDIPLILLSMGRDGSRAYSGELRVEVPAFLQEDTVETTGAGDTFGACCLHHILEYGLEGLTRERLVRMLTFANGAASIITTRKGALRVMPTGEEVEKFIAQKNS